MKEEGGNKTFYVYGLGLIGEESAAGYKAYHSDFRGSTVALSDAAGTVAERFQYGPYGELVAGNASVTPFLFNGMYGVMTDGNGLYYMRARFYSAEIKRFLNRDVLLGSVARGQSLNRFGFVEGRLISYIDPFGLSGKPVDVPGTNATVRIDAPHVPDQQKHAHICQKGCDEVVINIDGTGSHGTDPSKIKNKKLLNYLAKKGFKVALKCGAPLFFVYDWYADSFGHAVDELTWPASEIWVEDSLLYGDEL